VGPRDPDVQLGLTKARVRPLRFNTRRMGKVIVGATVSLDGFIADGNDDVGPLFDWYGNGDVAVTLADPDRVFHVTEPSAEYIRALGSVRATVIGRRLFDITNGWHGVPAGGEHVFVVTHSPPTDWGFPDAPFTFVTDGVASAIAQARDFAGDCDVSVTAGDIGSQALEEGLVDELHLGVVPVLFGSGKRFFRTATEQMLENPRIIQGDRVLHLAYDVRRG
jgi:dihydrofolate reductase